MLFHVELSPANIKGPIVYSVNGLTQFAFAVIENVRFPLPASVDENETVPLK